MMFSVAARTLVKGSLRPTVTLGRWAQTYATHTGAGSLNNADSDEKYTAVHFRLTNQAHPLKTKTWKNPTQNHVWTEDEVDEALAVQTHVKPTSVVDKVLYGVVRGAYHSFNFLTGYNKTNPSVRSVQTRLLFLESVAGVPGMVAASMRHFRSLRTMNRDHGWIHTLLEEAENERMHLLVFMNLFRPGIFTRMLVIAAQVVLVTALTGTYAVRPQAMHRFVGYLEETAVVTYSQVIELIQTPGTKLNKEWKDLPAPDIARNYWRLDESAKLVDVLRHIAADETHHRDVNHTFASLDKNATNPFVLKHLDDAATAWRSPTFIDAPEKYIPQGIGSFPRP